jgi:hypothetical protein
MESALDEIVLNGNTTVDQEQSETVEPALVPNDSGLVEPNATVPEEPASFALPPEPPLLNAGERFGYHMIASDKSWKKHPTIVFYRN